MRRSLLKFILFTAALASVAPTLGCQPRVVLVSFDAEDVGGDVDRLFIEGITPVKSRRELSGLQVIGYYDVSPSTHTIEVRVTACWSGALLADYLSSQDVHGDEVRIRIQPTIQAALSNTPSCQMGFQRPGMGGAGGDGAGGAAGAGGEMDGGAGGSAGVGAGGSALGGDAAGGASGSDGGVTDSAECGTDTHAPVCDPPSGDPGVDAMPDPPSVSLECIQYCSDIRSECGAVYDSDDSCHRYCALAGWSPSGGNSLACRNMYLSTQSPAGTYCSIAGPTGGNANCGGLCQDFCAAWIGICHIDPSESGACLTACLTRSGATGGADPACRFHLLQQALYDTRYCGYVKFGTCFSCD